MTRKQEMTKSEQAKGDPGAEVVLLSFAKPKGSLLCGTPFGGKIEMMLRLANIPYTGYVGNILNSKHAPKRKFPVLRHGKNVIADSTCIQKYLQDTYPDKLSMLVPQDPNTGALELALRKMFEEHLYFCFLYCVWVPDENFRTLRDTIFAEIPAVIRPLLARQIRKKSLRDLYGQGLGRHSMSFIRAQMAEQMAACAKLLELSGAYLTGSTPTLADCFLFSMIDQAVYAFGTKEGLKFPFADEVKKQPQLIAFHERLRKRCFPEGTTEQWASHAP